MSSGVFGASSWGGAAKVATGPCSRGFEGKGDSSINVFQIMPAFFDEAIDLDITYVDMNEHIDSGDLLIRASRVGRVADVERVEVHTRGSDTVRDVAPFDDFTDYTKIYSYYLGNFPSKIRVSRSIYNLYEDRRELVARAKVTSGVIHKIRSKNEAVIERWIGKYRNFDIELLENFLNLECDWVTARERGIVLSRHGLRLSRVGDWFLACVVLRASLLRKRTNLRLLLECIVRMFIYHYRQDDIKLGDLAMAIESWLIQDTCTSCLKKILRVANPGEREVLPYPYMFWNSGRYDEKRVTVDGSTFLWVRDPW